MKRYVDLYVSVRQLSDHLREALRNLLEEKLRSLDSEYGWSVGFWDHSSLMVTGPSISCKLRPQSLNFSTVYFEGHESSMFLADESVLEYLGAQGLELTWDLLPQVLICLSGAEPISIPLDNGDQLYSMTERRS